MLLFFFVFCVVFLYVLAIFLSWSELFTELRRNKSNDNSNNNGNNEILAQTIYQMKRKTRRNDTKHTQKKIKTNWEKIKSVLFRFHFRNDLSWTLCQYKIILDVKCVHGMEARDRGIEVFVHIIKVPQGLLFNRTLYLLFFFFSMRFDAQMRSIQCVYIEILFTICSAYSIFFSSLTFFNSKTRYALA